MTQKSTGVALVDEVSPETSFTPVVSSSGMSYAPFLELGEGGMAKILLARAIGPSGFNKLVVLKEMHPSLLEDEGLHQMFVDEARLSARFNHPNLVQVQEVNTLAQPPFLVMEYLDGKPMSALRQSDGITLGMRLCIISEVLNGLHYAHELANFDGSPLGIVHRDVSPHNVFITYDGTVKVLDFGIAKMVMNSIRTEAGEVKGKLAYMAPEQLLGSGVDRRADIFSVGSLLWEAAVGKRMWDGVAEGTLMHRLVSGEIPRPSQHAAVDPELEEIILRATAPEADDRYATAEELRLELDRYIARSGEHCSFRQIGAELMRVFQDERQRRAALINIALRESLKPPASLDPAEADVAVEPPRPHSRLPLLAVAALVLLAFAGFFAPKLLRSPTASVASGAPASALPAEVGTAMPRPAEPLSAPTALAAPVDSIVPPAPSVETSLEPTKKKGRPGLTAPPKLTPNAVAPAPAAAPPRAQDERCTPPYYFVGGIKTYKPECL
jgi:serine/threonine-protein kinase